MNFITLSIKKPITMLMVLASMIVMGLYSYRLIAVDNMPDTNIPIVTVQIIYPGASPDEIETSVIEKLEDEFALLEGIKKIKATVLENVGIIILEFDQNTLSDFAAIDVKDKVDAIKSKLPSDIEDPVIGKYDMNDKPILALALSGPGSLQDVRKLADDVVKTQLGKVSGVASINIIGGLEREIHVNLIKSELEARGLSISNILQIIGASNLDFPLGSIETNNKEINLRIKARIESIEDLRNLEIPSKVGNLRLGEIALIEDGHKEITNAARFNNHPAVGLEIKKSGDANVVATAQEIKKAIPRIAESLPEGYTLDIAKDQSIFIQNSVDDVKSNIILGIILTAAILFVFLRSFSMTVIASVTMPASLIAAFTFIWGSGFSINSMTLMALGISVGILVTNSIVILENISKHLAAGNSPAEAAEKGTSEIAMAVFASTLTNLAVFVPIAFMQSLIGQFFKEFGLTIVYATITSLIISFTLTPMMAAKMLKKPKKQRDESKGFLGWLTKMYAKALVWSLTKKGAIVTFAIIIGMFASLFVVGPLIGSSFTPKTDEGVFEVTVEMPAGTNLNATDNAAIRVENALSETVGVKSWLTSVGGIQGSTDGKNIARITAQMLPLSERDVTTQQTVDALRNTLINIPNAVISVIPTSSMGGDPNASDLDVQITGSNFNEMIEVSDKLIEYIRTTGYVADVKSSWKSGKPERVFRPNRAALADYGLTVGQVAQSIRSYVYGQEVSVYRESNEEFDILVRYQKSDRSTPSDILSATILSPKSGYIPLSAVVSESIEEGPSTLNRQNKSRLVIVKNYMQTDVSPGTLQSAIALWTQENVKTKEVSIGFGGNAERMGEAMVDFGVAILMAIILTYILLTALLESFSQPLIIMSTIPLGLIGVIWSLFITGKDISIIALMAIVMLIGIVVNNAILILDDANQLVRQQGFSATEAIHKSSVGKFRAIIMTNMATILAMVPLALGLGEGAEFRQPMAITAIGGLIVSTTLTVFVIPIMYKALGRFMDRKIIRSAKKIK